LENAAEMRGDLLLAGVDAGTSATKACLFRGDGTTVAEAGVPVAVSHPAPGLAEQPAEVLVDSACEALRAVATAVDPPTIAAIGITGQMGGLVLVDNEGVAVSPHISWLDGRAAPEVDLAMASQGDRLLALGGLPPYLAPKAAWWRREHHDGYERARRLVMPAGYLALRLAGAGAEAAVVDRSSSGFVGLYDVPPRPVRSPRSSASSGACLCRSRHESSRRPPSSAASVRKPRGEPAFPRECHSSPPQETGPAAGSGLARWIRA
jgi:sugar (pentulose or hexulose) kinase